MEMIYIKEKVAWEITADAVIFRNEFEKHRSEYLNDPTEKNYSIIFAFIFLQVYIEYFLHQNMRRVVRFEFKNTKLKRYQDWLSHESDYIHDKYSGDQVSKCGKLTRFIDYFFDDTDAAKIDLNTKIQKIFKYVTKIRNRLVHGHDISTSGDDIGNVNQSKVKDLLTTENFLNTIKMINELGNAWNELLDSILPKCKALRCVDDFKFPKLEI